MKFDVAFDTAKACSRYGVDDGGILNRLKSKAADLNSRASSLKGSNPAEAKRLWRIVVTMVPSTDSSFRDAMQGLKSASSSSSGSSAKARSDEDE